MPRKKKNPMEIASDFFDVLKKPDWLHGVGANLTSIIVYTWDEPTDEVKKAVSANVTKGKYQGLKVVIEKRRYSEWYEKERPRAKRDKG